MGNCSRRASKVRMQARAYESSPVGLRNDQVRITGYDCCNVGCRHRILCAVEVVRVRRCRTLTINNRERAVINLEASSTECFACRVLPEPDVIVARVKKISDRSGNGRSHRKSDKPGTSLRLGGKLGHRIVLGCADEDMLLANAKIFGAVDAHSGAAEEDDVVGPRDPARFLRGSTDCRLTAATCARGRLVQSHRGRVALRGLCFELFPLAPRHLLHLVTALSTSASVQVVGQDRDVAGAMHEYAYSPAVSTLNAGVTFTELLRVGHRSGDEP